MSRFPLNKIAAFLVLILAGGWVLTGEFSSIGSAVKAEGGTGVSEEAFQPAATVRTVGVIKPDFMDHARVIRIPGVTEADKRVTLATRSAGVIADLAARKGAFVRAGDVLAEIEGPERLAAVKTAEALLEQRMREMENAERLVDQGIAPSTQTDTARSALAAARAQLEAAEADVDRLRVVAPFDGFVDEVMAEKAAYLASGDPVAVLIALDPIVVTGEVSERDIMLVKPGSGADVRLIDGRMATGTVRHVSLEARAATRTFPVEIAIANPDRQIPAGMTAEIQIAGETVRSVLLLRSAVTLDAAGNLGVRIVQSDDTVGFVGIDLIDDTPEGLVLGGIPGEARVIVAGQDLVSDGDRVNPVASAAAAETVAKP